MSKNNSKSQPLCYTAKKREKIRKKIFLTFALIICLVFQYKYLNFLKSKYIFLIKMFKDNIKETSPCLKTVGHTGKRNVVSKSVCESLHVR